MGNPRTGASAVHIIVLDFETFYSQKFSLSKMTTEEYIRDPQFEVTGVSVKVDAGETKFFSGPKAATKMFLSKFDWDNAIAVAHNAMFDMAILNCTSTSDPSALPTRSLCFVL